ncbi:MAG: hypothetical protein AAB893_01895 [Patescibacteria group bacterium]
MTIRKYGLAYSSDILTVKHGFSIKGATNSNDWGERKEFLNSVLASNRITYVSTSQVHSTKVFEYVGKELGAGDGIVYKKDVNNFIDRLRRYSPVKNSSPLSDPVTSFPMSARISARAVIPTPCIPTR